jgi:predicted  nucleic acid-binding Zn-ribbon protein
MEWLCQICGYVHEDDEPPETCPVCGAPRSKFTEWSGDEDDLDRKREARSEEDSILGDLEDER